MIRSLLLASVVPSASACLADLRPASVVPGEDQVELAERGRALIDAAAEAHGLDAWRDKRTTELLFRDRWRGLHRAFNPWPSADITARIVQRAHSFDSVVTFLDEADAGLVWGIEDGRAWTSGPDGERRDSDDGDLRFMLPTVHYFVEMPFRFPEAEIFRSAGVETLDGVDYEVVYLTWRSVEANRDFDQYLVYLDPQTGRIAKVAYTVREIMGPVTALAHFDDLREVDGVWLPHVMWVGQLGGAAEDWFHEMSIGAVRFDGYDPATLEPLRDTVPLEASAWR